MVKRVSKTEVANLKKEIQLLRDQLDSVKLSVLPLVQHHEAEEEAKDRILISCDASCVNGERAAVGVVIRSVSLQGPRERAKDLFTIATPIKATSSNEAELDAIYMGLSTLNNTLVHCLHDRRVKFVEIRSDSQLCIGWISGRKKAKLPKLINKIDVIKETIKGLTLLSGKAIKVYWRRRNSTHDLNLANSLAQETNGVKQH